jgi:uncharacterized protein (UPF0333 family)
MKLNSNRGQISIETAILIAAGVLSAVIVAYYLVVGSSKTAESSANAVKSVKNVSLKGFA